MTQNQVFHDIGLFGLGAFVLSGFLLLLVWSVFWKGWALWLAARRGDRLWFVLLLVINTVGVLEIIYIFAIAKQSDNKHE